MLRLFEELGFAPKRCTWEITLACNLRCGHCGSRAGAPRDDELDTSEAFQVIDDLAALGCRHVTLAGGEPTLRADWAELMRRLNGLGVRCSMISNGLTWSEELTRQAIDAGAHRMGFSLDGLERTHDCVRRAHDGFRRVLAAIDTCVRAGVGVVAVTHVTRRSLPELERIHSLLSEHGVEIWQVQLGVPSGNLAGERESVVGPAEVLDLVPRIAALNRAGRAPKVFAADNVGYYGEHEEHLRHARKGSRLRFWLGCRAGLDVLGIESHGDVKGCLSLPSSLNGCDAFVEGNVRKRRLTEIWNDPKAFAYNRRFREEDLRGACVGCEWGEICRGGCTWTSFAHHGHAHEFPQCYYLHSGAGGHGGPAGSEE